MTNETKKVVNKMSSKTRMMWEIIAYIGLVLCVFGQITVGKFYLVAQFAYLIANISAVIRDFAIHLPPANKVKDMVFTGITLALIVCKMFI